MKRLPWLGPAGAADGRCIRAAESAAAVGRGFRPEPSVSLLAELGALVGDPARTNMLMSLRGRGEMTARELADAAGIAPQTASGHLSKLRAAGLVCVEKRGRYRFYRLGSDGVADLLDAFHAAGARLGLGRGRRSLARAPVLLRTCRGHMAGPLAEELAGAILERSPGGAVLGKRGRDALALWGLAGEVGEWELCAADGEGAEHVGGVLGAALLAHSLALGWVRRMAPGELAVTLGGGRGFRNRFGIPSDGRIERAGASGGGRDCGDEQGVCAGAVSC